MTEPMTARARVGVPAKAVHQALTDPAQLRIWLAEHAEVQLPDRYEFWGRHVPGGEAPRQSPQQIDDHLLRFTWLLDGQDTVVQIDLEEPDDGSTVITVSQTHCDLSDPGPLGMLQTFWALAIANLVDHLEGRALTPRCDYTSPTMRAEVVVDAPITAVYESLIEADQVSRWFGFPIEIDPQVGGTYGFGKILELEPDRKVAVEFAGAGVTTWELAGSGGRTRLTLVQSGFGDAQPPYATWAGGLSGLAELRRFHELTDWRPIWLADQAG
jgi:uncharacterized protein YndB with AHSA1/START domain